MKNLKKKFIAIVIIFIISILGIEIYKSVSIKAKDRNSYVVLIDGKAKLNENFLEKNKKEKLKPNDKITTFGDNSLAIIKWGDGSITRLGENSVLKIDESQIDKDLLNIKIAFSLEKGKTWSDVISFMGENSYFHESFADTTAAVRGTIFELNLDKDYVYVENHEVILSKKSGEKKVIPEKKPFILSKFTFADLLEFIQKFKDKTWQNLNKKLDKQFYKDLLRQVGNLNNFGASSIEKLSQLDKEQKEKLYKELLKQYQKINFISANDIENYKKKLELKKALLSVSDGKQKENLLITTLYDIKTLKENKNLELLLENMKILSVNANYLKNLNIDFGNYLDVNLLRNIEIPEGLKESFSKNFENLKQNFNLENLNIDSNIVNSIKDSASKSINGVSDTIKNIKNTISND